ncbi:MAG TPA: iron chelate uptake ABC transporter family permease subunit [Candidatus Limnocylindrales bacterium]|nr:iron chelate uptake ABC transporter family permease subunit [Candidatus Limnocylindrales bacterium]
MTEGKVEGAYVKRSSRWKIILAALVLALVLTIIVSLGVGYASSPHKDMALPPITFLQILYILGKQIPLVGNSINSSGIFVSPSAQASAQAIIILIRLPRVLAAALVGAGLAAAGVIYQGVFRNPMADSYLLGASAGASVGYTIAVLYVSSALTLVGMGIAQVFAFVFAILTVFVVLFMSRVGTKIPVTTLLLSGIVVNIFLLAIETLMELHSGQALTGIVAWLAGGFSSIVWLQVWAVIPFVFIGITITYFFTRDLNMLSMGDETAHHLGVNTERVRQILLVVASMMTAAAVAISGVIGFVGLIIPHMTRLVIGPDHRILLPASAIVGAMFLVICDAVARVATGASELPVGVITALVGTPFFIYLLRRRKTTYSL